jgi:phage gp36-like protein
MNFLIREDFENNINSSILEQIIGTDVSKLDTAEKNALAQISSKLSGRFDIQQESSMSGDARNSNLIRWAVAISVYAIYNTIPDQDIPERVRDNYTDSIKEIANIAAGKEGSDLLRITSSDGKSKTKFRWGSSTKRTHNPFD